MAYNENIPQAFENPSDSQGKLLANFQAISTAFNLNHGNFNDPDQGKHEFLQMPEQASAPTTLTDEAGFYSQNSTLTGVTELVFRRESNGDEIEFTGFLGATDGWTRLPSGILLKWGSDSGSGATPVTLPTGSNIPIFVAVFSGLVSVVDSSSTPNTFATLQNITNTSLLVFGSSRSNNSATSANFNYLIIGV